MTDGLSGLVFADSNANGIQDEGEGGVEGVLVLLEQGERTIGERWETRTDSAGIYRFWGLPPGSYQLGVQLPAEYGNPSVEWQAVGVTSDEENLVLPPIAALRLGWHLYLPTISKDTGVRLDWHLYLPAVNKDTTVSLKNRYNWD